VQHSKRLLCPFQHSSLYSGLYGYCLELMVVLIYSDPEHTYCIGRGNSHTISLSPLISCICCNLLLLHDSVEPLSLKCNNNRLIFTFLEFTELLCKDNSDDISSNMLVTKCSGFRPGMSISYDTCIDDFFPLTPCILFPCLLVNSNIAGFQCIGICRSQILDFTSSYIPEQMAVCCVCCVSCMNSSLSLVHLFDLLYGILRRVNSIAVISRPRGRVQMREEESRYTTVHKCSVKLISLEQVSHETSPRQNQNSGPVGKSNPRGYMLSGCESLIETTQQRRSHFQPTQTF